jgi:cobalamin synthase
VTVRGNIILAIVELALAVAAYVFLKPLIGYWCLIPVAIFGWLTFMAALAAVVVHVINSPDEAVEPDEGKERRRRRESIILRAVTAVLLVVQPFFVPHTTGRIAVYTFSVLVFVYTLWSSRHEWFRASASLADITPPESGQPEDD